MPAHKWSLKKGKGKWPSRDNSSSGGETVETSKRRRKISTEVDVVRVGEDVVPNNNCI